jgi:hypothetical protein
VLTQREGYLDDLLALFQESESVSEENHFADGPGYAYQSTVAHLRDRLRLLGFTQGGAAADFEQHTQAWLDRSPNPGADEIGVDVRDAAAIRNEVRAYLNSDDPYATYDDYAEPFFSMDLRTQLRLHLDAVVDENAPVRYELDDLVRYEVVTPGEALADRARANNQDELLKGAPLIVLTEGSSDSKLLASALLVTHPHLEGFLRFMDFDRGAPGSVGHLVNLVRGFVGAGVTNRVVVLADNDTASRSALAGLDASLPPTYRVVHYPDLDLLRSYPTLGPQSDIPVPMDVNGLAGSLEMYLGEELLRDSETLVPVQWTGWDQKLGAYQGQLIGGHKDRIQRAFRRKVERALEGAETTESDWTGVEAVFEAILHAFE